MIDIDLLSSQHLHDPYPTYERLRAEGPIVPLGLDRFLATDHATVTAILRNHDLFSSEGTGHDRDFFRPDEDATGLAFGSDEPFRMVIRSDPPDHTTLRRLVREPFTPRAIAALEPEVRRIAEGCVDDLVAHGQDADFMREVAFPLPVTVIAGMLGVPVERRDDFKRWSDNLALSVGSNAELDTDTTLEMYGFFDDLVAERRVGPGDDLVSRLIIDAGEELTTTEVIVFCQLLLVAGNETTTNLLGNCLNAALHTPGAVAAVRGDPGLVPAMFEEALRYDAPVQGTLRRVVGDTELAGTTLPADSRVLVLLGSANRDPAVFPHPDTFRPERSPTDHVAFGSGIHFCLGAGLSRLEARVLADVARSRIRSLQITRPAVRSSSAIVRGFTSMPVNVVAA